MHTKQTFEQKGVTLAVTSPILSALQAVQGTVKSVERVGQSKNDRVNAMAAANSAMDAYRAGQAVGQAGKAMQEAMENGNMDSVVGAQITYGQQKSESRTHTEGKTAAKSQVNAGGKVNIVATGAGKASNITIQGSDVSGKQGTFLEADNDINITAAEQTHKERSTNKSSGFNAGLAMKVSNGAVVGATLGGNHGKGYGNGDETTYVASHVGDSQSKTVIQAGGDANIIGSQVKGKRVEVNAQNLNIESLQDTATYKGKQMNVSGSVTVGYGVSAGGSYNKSKVNADHASVNEQAGIYAGDEGYDINVNHTDLKGGLITSTQKAEDEGKNRFSTGTLTHSDIENHSNYSGSSFGVSGSVAANFDTPFGKEGQAQSSKQAVDEDGNLIYRNDRGELTTEAKNAQGKDNAKQLATGWDSLETTHSVGFGYDKDSQSSTTKSGINTKNIEIRDQAGQLAKTGETVEQTRDRIKTEVTTDNAAQHSGKLENHFDKDKVQKELDLQRDVTEQFGNNLSQGASLISEKLSEKARKQKYEAAVALEQAQKAVKENDSESNRTLERQAQMQFDKADQAAKEWETGGRQRRLVDSAMNVLSTALAGRPAAEVVASGLSPMVNHHIKEATKGQSDAVNLTAHALWGAVEAYAGNRNVAAGAAGAVAGEAAAKVIAETLYGKSPNALSQEEKLTVSTLSQAAAGIAGGALANSSDGVGIAAQTAKGAVENNFFDQAYKSTDYANGLVANTTVQTQLSEATRQAAEEFEKAHPELVKNLRTTGDIGAFLADFTPIIGDIKSFVEAENGIDYALATVGLIPGADVVTKPLKEAKNALNMAKAAEKAGNVAEAIKYQKEAADHIKSSVNGFYESKNIANLGGNRNKGLNERISNRQKDHYINEQATKNVHKVTAPIDFDGHILNVEVSKRGKLVGGHSIANGNVHVISKGSPNSAGVYEAKIQYTNPENGKVLTKNSTMFPDSWSADRVKYEVDMAYKNRNEYINPQNGKVMWESTTPSGVKVTGYKEPKVTVYPLMK